MAGNYGSDAFLMQPFVLADPLLLDTDQSRIARYQAYLDFYNGAQWTEKRKPGERRLTVNYSRVFIQKAASYMMGRPISFELEPNGDSKAAEEEAAKIEKILADIWRDNNLAQVDYDTAVDAAILGDGAYKITLQPGTINPLAVGGGADRPADGRRKEPIAGGGRVVVKPVDVMGLTCGWQADDMRCLTWVIESYRMDLDEANKLYGPLPSITAAQDGRVIVAERWTTETIQILVDGTEVQSQPNSYGFIPYVIFPNLSQPRLFWGLSDLDDLMTLNSEFNVRISVLSQLLQMSGNPVLVLQNVEDAQGMRVGPGAIWTLPDGAKAELLELLKNDGIALHVQYVDLLYKMLHDLSELPDSGFGNADVSNASSGVAIETLLYPVVQKVNRKRRIWDAALDQRNRMIMALAGLPIHRSKFSWPDVLPRDRAALVTQEVGLTASNIHSLKTARRNLGDEQPDLENDQIIEEHTALAAIVGPGAAGPNAAGGNKGINPPVHLSGALVQGLSGSGG
jgi:hypothetical protein